MAKQQMMRLNRATELQGEKTMGYVDSWYARTLSDATDYPALEGEREADVCIIGAGLAGLTAASELARSGKRVIVLEAERIGWGASGRNGGFVSPGYAASLSLISLYAGAERAKALYRLSIEGADMVRGNVDALDARDACKPVHGKIGVMRHPARDALMQRRDQLARDFGYEVAYMPRDDVRAVLRSDKYFDALHDPQAFHFHPLNYARALARDIIAHGGAIFENSAVIGAVLDAPEKRLRTIGGSVRARDVVLAGGGYTTDLVPELRRAYLPIATYVLLTEPALGRIAQAVTSPCAISDNRRANDYYRLVDDGRRLLWGGRMTTRRAEPRDLAALLRKTMVSTYPQLSDLRVEIAWSGLMSYARHLMPQIGRLREGVYYCTAFGGHGLNTTAIGGRVVAEAITGESDRIRLFEPFGLAWNGGPFGTAAVQLTYWSYQARDWWKERRAA